MLYQGFALHPYGVAIATMFTCRFLCRLIIQRHWDFIAPSIPSQAQSFSLSSYDYVMQRTHYYRNADKIL